MAEIKHADSLVIGTRESPLAMWQAEFVRDRIMQTSPGVKLEIVGMTSEGDRNQAIALSKFATKGIFTKELDRAMLTSQIDIAVHSLKDLPTTLPPGLRLAAILQRGRVEDAVVLHQKHSGCRLADLPLNSVIGTSSLRRRALISKFYPHLICRDIRGNVQTRLRRLDKGHFDAIVLAAVGLERVGLGDRISEPLDPVEFPHAVGQGALAVVCRGDDSYSLDLLAPLVHKETTWMCTAERALLRTLEGGCKVPIAVRSEWLDDSQIMRLYGCVVSVDGSVVVEHSMATKVTTLDQADKLGADVASYIRDNGGREILQQVRMDAEESA